MLLKWHSKRVSKFLHFACVFCSILCVLDRLLHRINGYLVLISDTHNTSQFSIRHRYVYAFLVRRMTLRGARTGKRPSRPGVDLKLSSTDVLSYDINASSDDGKNVTSLRHFQSNIHYSLRPEHGVHVNHWPCRHQVHFSQPILQS